MGLVRTESSSVLMGPFPRRPGMPFPRVDRAIPLGLNPLEYSLEHGAHPCQSISNVASVGFRGTNSKTAISHTCLGTSRHHNENYGGETPRPRQRSPPTNKSLVEGSRLERPSSPVGFEIRVSASRVQIRLTRHAAKYRVTNSPFLVRIR